MARRVNVLVGTAKGAFVLESDESRRDWTLRGPLLPGWEVYSLLGDSRRGNRLYAGTSHFAYGPTIQISEDRGESWTPAAHGPSYSPESGFKLTRIWQIAPGHATQPDRLYAGVEEAGLFVSDDSGQTWRELSGLTSHPSRPGWFPGGGGMCLHTILVDPGDAERLWVAASAVGAFRSDDGGRTWAARNEGLPAVATGMDNPEVGRCVHKMVLDPSRAGTLYMQFHGGVFRSHDNADSWHPIEAGLPGNFGFPMVITPSGDLFVAPLESDEHRYPTGGELTVYRSTDGGDSWAPTAGRLPDRPQFVNVLRDAMATDGLTSAGLYLGTSNGDVYASPDTGETWSRLPGKFSRITSVKTWVTGA